MKHPCDSVISVSVLGLRGGRNLDRIQRTYYQGGFLSGEDEDSCILYCSVLYCFSFLFFFSVSFLCLQTVSPFVFDSNKPLNSLKIMNLY